jgi:tetratricopeptide (TPR) repeat protein
MTDNPTPHANQGAKHAGLAQERTPVREVGLEDERDFLLASLRDLEREHEVGDLDDADYAALRDDYTARAARVLRAIEAGQAEAADDTAADAPRSRRRAVVAGALVLLFAVVAGVLVARSAGRRDPGEVATGGVRQSSTEKLNQAGRLLSSDLDGAIDLYDEVLAEEPDNVEALAYKGWAQTLSGEGADGLTALIKAARADPTYPDAHAFLAIVLFRGGLIDEASRELDRLDALDPPAQIRQLTEGLRQRIEAARAGSSTTSTPG